MTQREKYIQSLMHISDDKIVALFRDMGIELDLTNKVDQVVKPDQ